MPNVQFEHFHKKYFKAYAEFAWEEWDKSSHQSSENYINWLYNENPCIKNSKERGFLLALFEDKVVGCIHKMRLMWRVKDQIEYIPTIHNLMVAENHRRKGCGMLLLKHSFLDETHGFVPGVIKDQKNIYKFLKCQKVNSCWYRKVLTPFKGLYYLTKKRFFNHNAPPAFFSSYGIHKIRNRNPYVKITIESSEGVIEKVVSRLNEVSLGMVSTYWTMELFKWRFFHPFGPKHLMIYKESGHDINDFLILSLGPRKGLNIARIIEMEASSLETLNILMKSAEKITKLFGGHLLFNFSCSSKLNEMLVKLKYRIIKNPPNTYFYHKNKKDTFQSFSFNGSACDLGFESIL